LEKFFFFLALKNASHHAFHITFWLILQLKYLFKFPDKKIISFILLPIE